MLKMDVDSDIVEWSFRYAAAKLIQHTLLKPEELRCGSWAISAWEKVKKDLPEYKNLKVVEDPELKEDAWMLTNEKDSVYSAGA